MTHAPRRFLVVTTDAAGNWPPELALIRALVARGHEVRVLSNETHAAAIRAAGASYLPFRFVEQRDTATRHDAALEPEFQRVLRTVFLNPLYGDELRAELERGAPDVLLVDQMLWMAAAEAEHSRLPTATLWHTVYGAQLVGRARLRGEPLAPLAALRAARGLPPIEHTFDVPLASEAILAFTLAAFDEPSPDTPRQLHYVGPLGCLPQPGSAPAYALPFAADDPRPLVLVSYSTSFQDQVATLQRVADALRGLPARALFTLGSAIAPGELRLPENAVAQAYVPHAAVLPHASLVVTHAGHGTAMASVCAGVPMVCTPMGRDQHMVAACVERTKLGRVVEMTAPPEELRAAIGGALGDPSLRARARRFAAGVDLPSGLARALDVLEGLRARPR